MLAWKEQLSAMKMSQVTSFVMSLNGSTPASPSEPEGELYNSK